MSDSAGDKRHNATPLHRRKAWEQGRYAKSSDLSAALMLLSAAGIVWLTGSKVVALALATMNGSMTIKSVQQLHRSDLIAYIQTGAAQWLWVLMPLILGVFAVGLIHQWLQSGFRLWTGKIGLDLRRVDPIKGMRRITEFPTWIGIFFALLKIAAASSIAIAGLWGNWGSIQQSQLSSVAEMSGVIWRIGLGITWQIACAWLILGIAEYGVQFWRHEQELKMTDEELREELKTTYGDPQLAARRGSLRQELLGNVSTITPATPASHQRSA